jgi:hypothetical protein
VSAEEILRLDQRVSDTDFYRAISCSAQPGGKCKTSMIRWPHNRQRDLRIALARIAPGYPKREATIVDNAIDRAIAEINDAGSNIVMRRVAPAAKADVNIFLLDIPQGSKLRGSRIRGMDGTWIDAANVTVWWKSDTKSINRGVIVVAPGHSAFAYRSIMLEELFQSLGFMTDIIGLPYETGSIVAENANIRSTLGRQDIAALALHYPVR